jgi:hypothetical protein
MVLLGEISFTNEGAAVIGILMSALAGAIGILWKKNDAGHERELTDVKLQRDKELADMKAQRDSYKEIGHEAVTNLGLVRALHPEAIVPTMIPRLVPVIPEHNSPTTQVQRDAAELQTMRAQLVAETLRLGLPARKEAPMAEEKKTEEEKPPDKDVTAVKIVEITPDAVTKIADEVAAKTKP